MRTLICEGIGAFIVVESWPLFSWLVDGAFIKPLPNPCFARVMVFVPSAINPMTGSRWTFCCLWGRSPLDDYCFLLMDRTVPLGATSPDSFLFLACDLINALFLASSISVKKDGWSYQLKVKAFYTRWRLTDLRLWILALYLTASGVDSGPSQYQWMVSGFTNFAQVLSPGLVFEKIFSRKLNSSILTCGHRLTAEEMDG